jgi:hypothetical protein
MSTILHILLYCLPVAFIALSGFYTVKQRKLTNSGRIPEIINAHRYQKLFLALSILTAMVLVVTI